MPSFHNDVLPDSPGLNLGSPSQPWNIYAANIFIGEQIIAGGVPLSVPYANPMVINGSGATVINIGPLTGDVDSSSFSSNISAGTTQFILVTLIQDGAGGRKFAWPSNFLGAQVVDNVVLTMNPGQLMNQMFLYVKDSDTAQALAPAVLYP